VRKCSVRARVVTTSVATRAARWLMARRLVAPAAPGKRAGHPRRAGVPPGLPARGGGSRVARFPRPGTCRKERPLDSTPSPTSTPRPAHDGGSPVIGAAGPAPALAQGSTPAPAELEAVRRRDTDALGRFFDTYFARVYAVALRLVGDRTR